MLPAWSFQNSKKWFPLWCLNFQVAVYSSLAEIWTAQLSSTCRLYFKVLNCCLVWKSNNYKNIRFPTSQKRIHPRHHKLYNTLFPIFSIQFLSKFVQKLITLISRTWKRNSFVGFGFYKVRLKPYMYHVLYRKTLVLTSISVTVFPVSQCFFSVKHDVYCELK